MPKPKHPAISEAESRVMDALWKRAPQASEDLAVDLHAATGWHENTVRTLLKRLVDKGAVTAERDGRRYLYTPVLTRDAWETAESRSLLNRVFGGRVAPMLAHFSEHEDLSDRDIAELRDLLDNLERKEKGNGLSP